MSTNNPNAWKPEFEKIRNELKRKLKQDDRVSQYDLNVYYRANNVERGMPAAALLSGRAEQTKLDSIYNNIRVFFRLEYIDRARNAEDGEEMAEKICFALQDLLNGTLDDQQLKTSSGTVLANGERGLFITNTEWGAFIDPETETTYSGATIEFTVDFLSSWT